MAFLNRGHFLLVLAALDTASLALRAASTTNDFSEAAGLTPYAVASWPAPTGAVVEQGALRLPATSDTNTIVVFDRTATNTCRRIVAQWDWTCPNAREGFSFNLLSTADYGTNGAASFASLTAAPCPFEEPVFTNSLSIAFDSYDTSDYQGYGAHELSLHWNGQERANRLCPIDFRTGTSLPVRAEIEFVPGGANVSVFVNGTAVYTNYFLACIAPYESRVAFGARATSTGNVWRVDNLNVTFEEAGATFPLPRVVRTFDSEPIDINNRNPVKSFDLPADGRSYARIVLAMTLSEPPGGFDPWDRQMNVCILDDSGERFEIARFITPYAKAWTWYADVTDFQTLLRGTHQMRAFIDTWVSPAWLVTVDLLYYEGLPRFEAFKVENLWVGEPLYGDTNNPISNFFTPSAVTIDPLAERVKTRIMVTGHGQSPNSENAAEFLVCGRTLTVGGTSFYNVLWKNDCYLNPCRPQSGTWQHSRAGWAPGDRVDPWETDITSLVTPRQELFIQYTADPYTNYNVVAGNAARHWVESQLISYRTPTRPSLSIQRVGDQVILEWPQGVLQAADEIVGVYTNVPGATSPWTNATTAPRQFFRLRF
jgi:hypothetical protein